MPRRKRVLILRGRRGDGRRDITVVHIVIGRGIARGYTGRLCLCLW